MYQVTEVIMNVPDVATFGHAAKYTIHPDNIQGLQWQLNTGSLPVVKPQDHDTKSTIEEPEHYWPLVSWMCNCNLLGPCLKFLGKGLLLLVIKPPKYQTVQYAA